MTENKIDQQPSKETLELEVIQAIRTVYDPEIPVNVYDLGLIYHIDIDANYIVDIKMTLTAPTCPEAQALPASVESAIRSIVWVVDVKLELVWDPPWTKDRIAEDVRMLLGM